MKHKFVAAKWLLSAFLATAVLAALPLPSSTPTATITLMETAVLTFANSPKEN